MAVRWSDELLAYSCNKLFASHAILAGISILPIPWPIASPYLLIGFFTNSCISIPLNLFLVPPPVITPLVFLVNPLPKYHTYCTSPYFHMPCLHNHTSCSVGEQTTLLCHITLPTITSLVYSPPHQRMHQSFSIPCINCQDAST